MRATAKNIVKRKMRTGGTIDNHPKPKYVVSSDNPKRYAYMDSLSNVMRGQQKELTQKLIDKYPNVPVIDILKSIKDDPKFNLNLDAKSDSISRKYNVDMFIPASKEYIQTSNEFNKFVNQQGSSFNTVGDKEGNKLEKFGVRNMIQRLPNTRHQAPYSILNNDKSKLAIGGEVKSKWSGTEYGQAAVSTGMGALAGAGTGALLGTAVLPGIGTAAGAIIGGVLGLASGILGGSAAAKQRAAAQEQQRQSYLAAVDDKKTTDATRLSEATVDKKATTFYAKLGGKIPRASGAGLIPIARNMRAVYGPTHEQSDGNGGTGVELDANTEVEGGGNNTRGEVIVDTAKNSKVYSDAFGIEHEGTFADISMNIGVQKGRLENDVKINEDMLDRTLQAVDKTVYNPTKGTHTRNAQKLAFRSQKLIARVVQADNQLDSLFNIQESAKNNIQQQDGQVRKMLTGGQTQGLVNVGSTLLQGLGNMITLKQMSKIPTPTRAPIQRAVLNSNIDISNQLEQLDSSTGQAMKYVKGNISNSSIATQHMKDILLNKNRSKNQLYAQKYAEERGIENQNVQLDYQNRATNNEISYENTTNQFNRTMDYYSKQSQAIAQATQGIQDSASQYAQSAYQDKQLAMYQTLNPKEVNNTLNTAMFNPNFKYDLNMPRYDLYGNLIKRYGGLVPRSKRKLKIA